MGLPGAVATTPRGECQEAGGVGIRGMGGYGIPALRRGRMYPMCLRGGAGGPSEPD